MFGLGRDWPRARVGADRPRSRCQPIQTPEAEVTIPINEKVQRKMSQAGLFRVSAFRFQVWNSS